MICELFYFLQLKYSEIEDSIFVKKNWEHSSAQFSKNPI